MNGQIVENVLSANNLKDVKEIISELDIDARIKLIEIYRNRHNKYKIYDKKLKHEIFIKDGVRCSRLYIEITKDDKKIIDEWEITDNRKDYHVIWKKELLKREKIKYISKEKWNEINFIDEEKLSSKDLELLCEKRIQWKEE
jgi:hypothetical protein